MARTAARVTSVKVSPTQEILPGYTSLYVMQLCRSAKQRSQLKNVPFAGLDEIYNHTVSELARNKNTCECCNNSFARKSDGKGGGGKSSLSLHRVIASLGYVPNNIKVICQGCNNAIGEINNFADVMKRVKALRWQAKTLHKAGKKLFDNNQRVE